MSHADDIQDTDFPDNDEYIPYTVGGTLAQRSGGKVMCWGLITKLNGPDGFTMKTADDQEVAVRLRQPASVAVGSWYEIYGTSQGKGIMCDELQAFSDEMMENIDLEGHKTLVKLLGALDDPWNLGDDGNANVNEGVMDLN